MEPSELLRRFAEVLERLQIPYLITGSMAPIAYGESRFTNDIDVVVALPLGLVDAFCQSFPETEFYCYPDAVLQAVRQQSQFNIIHFESGLKIDVMIPDDSEFNRSRLARGVRLPARDDFEATFSSPEDVIIKKLEFYQEGGSDKHLRDIAGVLKVRGERVDRDYITAWATRLGSRTTHPAGCASTRLTIRHEPEFHRSSLDEVVRSPGSGWPRLGYERRSS